jgi:K(+)-stimulated pyrophosphate-energized sodium pump
MESTIIDLSGTNLVTVVIVAVVAILALLVAAVLVREVLAADEGTPKMKEIAGAIQEGASAYLSRQFKTLAIFAVVVFFVLFVLPAETNSERIGRSIFFLVGAVFSGITGYMGMWLAVRGNVRRRTACHAFSVSHRWRCWHVHRRPWPLRCRNRGFGLPV